MYRSFAAGVFQGKLNYKLPPPQSLKLVDNRRKIPKLKHTSETDCDKLFLPVELWHDHTS